MEGPKDAAYATHPNQVKITRPFVARYLRITPTAFAILKLMRAEVYGCSIEDFPQEKGNYLFVKFIYIIFILSYVFYCNFIIGNFRANR